MSRAGPSLAWANVSNCNADMISDLPPHWPYFWAVPDPPEEPALEEEGVEACTELDDDLLLLLLLVLDGEATVMPLPFPT